ncbi:hypothetical protein ACFS6H_20150 [Terrimonas rubra]|uniref:Terminase n=1 Tax=Terrimonas rubra TaxID=1035890 RepID=A0ABW6A9W3_9BACT
MFLKRSINYTTVDVQGLACQVPPVGFVFNILTGQLEKREIFKRSELPANQYWERQEIPDWYKKKSREVTAKRETEPDFFDPKCNEYEAQEWDRRLNGFWFYNNGVPTYITGMHYLYLQWWKIDIGYPGFRIPDLEYFYFLQYCIDDPNSFGMCEITKRRFGKSFRAGLFSFEYVSRAVESQSGIQSKTGTDAKKFFAKAVVRPFKRLPDFFRPEYDKAQGLTPKTELRFQQTNVKGKKAAETLEKDELESMVDFQSSDAVAYDGQKLHRAVNDEFAKTVEVNIYDRHDVVRYCLLDDEGKIIGKALYTSTVEKLETEKNGVSDAARQLWTDSDQNNRQQNGQTISGLYRFFMPADRTRYFDRFGFPDEKKARQAILLDRESVKNDAKRLSARIRKEPLTIEEAFRADGDKCLYNSENLNNQRDFLSWNQDIVERGNFMWKEGKRDTEVVWKKSSNGRWLMLKGFNPKKEETNQVEQVGNQFYPKNNIRFGSAVDPYDHNQTEDNYKRSMAASLVKQKNNPYNFSDPMIGAYICRYYARPATAAAMYEDMIMQCRYFGISILAESNRPGIISYFRDRNHGAFLMHLPGYKEPGIPSTQENKRQASELIEATIEDNCDKIFFIDVIEDLLVFDINKTQKFDLAMAALWTEIACDNRLFRLKEKSEVTEVTELFKRHKIA